MEDVSFLTRLILFTIHFRRTITIIVTPIVLSPLICLYHTPDYRCVFVVVLMSVFWVTEVVPVSLTSMLPIVLLPALGILDSSTVVECYMKETTLMLLSCIMVIGCLERSNVHKRFGLYILKICSYSHRRLSFGFGVTAMLLSMWLPNDAVTTLMMPVIKDTLDTMHQEGLVEIYNMEDKRTISHYSSQQDIPEELVEANYDDDYGSPKATKMPRDVYRLPSDIAISYYLLAAYSSSIGAMSVLVGTIGNMTYKGIFEELFPKAPPVNFPYATLNSAPIMVLIELSVIFYFQLSYMGLGRPNSDAAKRCRIDDKGRKIMKRAIDCKIVELGPITCHEMLAALVLVLMVLLFVTREPRFIKGWAEYISSSEIGYSVPSTAIVILLFMLPRDLEFLKFFDMKLDRSSLPSMYSPSVLHWNLVHIKIYWGLLYLLGAGYSINLACQNSGMLNLMEWTMAVMKKAHHTVLPLLILLACKTASEFSSGIAVINIMMPLIAHAAIITETNPSLLMMAGLFGCRLTFLFPFGNPSNAIAAHHARIPIRKMVMAGIWPSILSIAIVWAALFLWTPIIYEGIHKFPSWARQ